MAKSIISDYANGYNYFCGMSVDKLWPMLTLTEMLSSHICGNRLPSVGL